MISWNARSGATARPPAAPETNFPMAAHKLEPSARAVACSASTVVLPMPRGGTFNTRNSEMSSSGCIARRTYAKASFTSARL